MPLPFVSVLVPVRNEERYIERCLYSIASQDYPRDRIEVLVLDPRPHRIEVRGRGHTIRVLRLEHQLVQSVILQSFTGGVNVE